jgi:hypothetical protein
MEAPTYPFPLAAHSSHHSHYHRFLLGAPAGALAPFPKPYCTGRIAGDLPRLAGELDLPRWRKLYQASIPWVEGHGPEHYAVGNAPPNRPLPRGYQRPHRTFGAYDFVQIADPSLSALALVAGDRRVLEQFVRLSERFCAGLEPCAAAWAPGPTGDRTTGRLLAGQFAEPSNRWLMPFLHVHSRVLNLTSFASAPRRLSCLDPGPLARAAGNGRRAWARLQADILRDLGYGAEIRGVRAPRLRVAGVSSALLAAIEAPRLAVLRLLERILVGERARPLGSLGSELPAAVVSTLVEQLEGLVAGSSPVYGPAKVGVPSEGPWRAAVRRNLSEQCPAGLAELDAAAEGARAERTEVTLLPAPPWDAAHRHAATPDDACDRPQLPWDPELGDEAEAPAARPCPWLAREYERCLADVCARVGRASETLAPLRDELRVLDQLDHGPSRDQVGQAARLLGSELERVAARSPGPWDISGSAGPGGPRSPEHEWAVQAPGLARSHELHAGIGGRSR